MTLTPRINEAIKLACHLHRNQIRKDKYSTPYVSHLFSVAMILSSVTEDEDIIIAGLMHDSLEDVPSYTYDMLVRDCGARVAEIVLHVTEPLDASKPDDQQLPWLIRKEKYMETLKQGGVESAMVSAADKIHNTESFIMDARTSGSAFTSRFSSSLRNKLWFHEHVLEIIKEKLAEGDILIERLQLCTDEFRKLATMDSH